MKSFARVGMVAVALPGALVVTTPQVADAAVAMVITVQVEYSPPLTYGSPIGCPTGVQFSPLPPEITDPCAMPRNVQWAVSGVGAITGGDGALGSFQCVFAGEERAVLANGEGDLDGLCWGGGIIGSGELLDCAVRYTRVGFTFAGVVNDCMLGAIAFQTLPTDTAFQRFAGIGTLGGA